jgi:hypothetical protein
MVIVRLLLFLQYCPIDFGFDFRFSHESFRLGCFARSSLAVENKTTSRP